MQKHVNLVDLVKSFPTNIYLQNLASIQKRTSPIKFAHLAEKSGNGSISNLSTKARTTTRFSSSRRTLPQETIDVGEAIHTPYLFNHLLRFVAFRAQSFLFHIQPFSYQILKLNFSDFDGLVEEQQHSYF